MVRLVKFWDTETAAILLLEYAAGGLLWRRLRAYFEKTRRLFRRYYEKKSSGDDKEGRHSRRSGSVDAVPAGVKQRNSTFSIGNRHRSGSDPFDRQSRSERNISTTSEPFEDDDAADEFLRAGRVGRTDNESSLFAMYEVRCYSLDIGCFDGAAQSFNAWLSFGLTVVL